MNKKVSFTSLLASLVFFVNAQHKEADSIPRLLDEVTVTAQRKPQKRLLVPYSVEYISAKKLERLQPRTTPEALMGVNGVFVQKTNHGGGSPFVRGLTGNQTLILIDGIRLNNSTFRYGPNQYLNTIDPYLISSIEVAKGTGSVQYGSDALGGVIQVFSKEPSFSQEKPAWHGSATVKYMTHDMEKTARAEGVYSSKKVAAQLGATYRNFGDLVGGDTTGRQTPSGYNEFAFDAKSKFLLKENAELTLAHQLLRQENVPVFHKVRLENFAVNEFDPQQRMLTYARLDANFNSTVFNHLQVIASWQQTMEGRNSRKNGSSIVREEMDEIRTLGITADVLSRFSERWTANSGVELYRDKVYSSRKDVNLETNDKNGFRGLYPDRSGYRNFALYSMHHFDFNKWTFEAGIRANAFSINIKDSSIGETKITPSCFVYNGAAMYHFSTSQHAYFSISSGYRAPNVDDLGSLGVVDFRYEIPTKDLSPEKSRHLEMGYKFQVARLSGNFAVYYMQLENLINRIRVDGQVINGYPVYRKENTERGYIKGVEAEMDYEPINFLHFRGAIAYSYGQSVSKNEPMRRIPPLHGRVMSYYRKDKWSVTTEYLFASKQDRLAQGDKDDNRIPRNGTPGWEVLNLYGSYQFTRIHFNLGFQNLLNEDYRTHGSGINGVGRSAWLSVMFKW